MFNRNRDKIRAIKADTARSREMLKFSREILDQEWQKANTPEERSKLEKLEHTLAEWRGVLDDNEAMIAKLERPFWKF